MFKNLFNSIHSYVSYRGGEVQISFLLHRFTGLGILFFLAIHIVDTSFVYFAPELYVHAIDLYRSTPFMIGEIILVFCVLFHGINGLRIAYYDLFLPAEWGIAKVRQSVWTTLFLTIALWIPAAAVMGYNLLHYNFGFFPGS